MKFRLSGQIKLKVEGLEIEGNDMEDAVRQFLNDPQNAVNIIQSSDDLEITDIDTVGDTVLETYQKEIDVEIYDIEWEIDNESPEVKRLVLNLPEIFRLEYVTVDNYSKMPWHCYYGYYPITEESENECIKEALLEYIASIYHIYLSKDNIKSFEKEITNEQ